MRETLAARIAMTPAPTLADVPPALVAPVLTALAALDPLERTASLRQWVQAWDTVAAVVAINAPQPFALVSAVERAELPTSSAGTGTGTTLRRLGRLPMPWPRWTGPQRLPWRCYAPRWPWAIRLPTRSITCLRLRLIPCSARHVAAAPMG